MPQSSPDGPLGPHGSGPTGFRIGSVPYLNAAPLTYGIEQEVMVDTPARLAVRLHRGELDAALISVTEVLFHNGYDILDGMAVASRGPVKSVYLAYRQPLEAVSEVFCDPASCTSVQLLKVLLAEWGIFPTFHTLSDADTDHLPANVLLIGNTAIDWHPTLSKNRSILDLGEAWWRQTGLPFVYAVWALHREADPALRQILQTAGRTGLDHLSTIIRQSSQYDFHFRREYLQRHIRYRLGAEEKEGLKRFTEMLSRHVNHPIYPVRFVTADPEAA